MTACVASLMVAGVAPGANDPVALAQSGNPDCRALPSAAQLREWLGAAASLQGPPVGGTVGGLFGGQRMWAAVVNRDGAICAATTSTEDPTQVWPGSQAIAKSKAYTANAFSVDSLPLSTARLYTFTQPGHSLWSLGQSNTFNAHLLLPPDGRQRSDIPGGLIFFGGGLPLYRDGQVIGALGVSGDTSCADHEIAKRVRHIAGLNPPGGPLSDEIVYSAEAGASVFAHPLCPNTYRNGAFVGNEHPASYP